MTTAKKLTRLRKMVPKQNRTCKECGKEFMAFWAEIKRGNVKYCSRQCFKDDWHSLFNGSSGAKGKHWTHTKEYKKKLSLSRMGDKNPNYIYGGTTKRRSKGNKSTRWWRVAVFERDDFTCQECGKRGGSLNAHHIQYWALYPKLRFIVRNGVTLCVGCHKYVHWVERLNTKLLNEANTT